MSHSNGLQLQPGKTHQLLVPRALVSEALCQALLLAIVASAWVRLHAGEQPSQGVDWASVVRICPAKESELGEAA